MLTVIIVKSVLILVYHYENVTRQCRRDALQARQLTINDVHTTSCLTGTHSISLCKPYTCTLRVLRAGLVTTPPLRGYVYGGADCKRLHQCTALQSAVIAIEGVYKLAPCGVTSHEVSITSRHSNFFSGFRRAAVWTRRSACKARCRL